MAVATATTYTALTVSSRTTRVTHLWVGTGNLCGVEFTTAPNVRQLQNNTICKKCAALQDIYEETLEAAAEERKRIAATAPARRLTLGQAAVTGWELLYQKPKGIQIGRHDKKYALICQTHLEVHRLSKLSDDRALLKGGNRMWCPECRKEATAAAKA